MAEMLKQLLNSKGYKFYIDSPTNQQFVIIEDEKLKELEQNVAVGFWEKPDADHTVIRFATSWATREEDILELEKYL